MRINDKNNTLKEVLMFLIAILCSVSSDIEIRPQFSVYFQNEIKIKLYFQWKSKTKSKTENQNNFKHLLLLTIFVDCVFRNNFLFRFLSRSLKVWWKSNFSDISISTLIWVIQCLKSDHNHIISIFVRTWFKTN